MAGKALFRITEHSRELRCGQHMYKVTWAADRMKGKCGAEPGAALEPLCRERVSPKRKMHRTGREVNRNSQDGESQITPRGSKSQENWKTEKSRTVSRAGSGFPESNLEVSITSFKNKDALWPRRGNCKFGPYFSPLPQCTPWLYNSAVPFNCSVPFNCFAPWCWAQSYNLLCDVHKCDLSRNLKSMWKNKLAMSLPMTWEHIRASLPENGKQWNRVKFPQALGPGQPRSANSQPTDTQVREPPSQDQQSQLADP